MMNRQKRFLAKWTVVMGMICAVITGIVLLISGNTGLTEDIFWFQIVITAMGGGILFGLLPAVLVEYRRDTDE